MFMEWVYSVMEKSATKPYMAQVIMKMMDFKKRVGAILWMDYWRFINTNRSFFNPRLSMMILT